MVGKLLYLIVTRLDITFFVQQLSQFFHNMKQSHYHVGMHVIRYIKGSPGQGVFFPSSSNLCLSAFCDADLASYPFCKCYISAYCVKLGGSIVVWKVKRQTSVTKSSAEVEYKSLSLAVAENVWLKRLLQELSINDTPATLHVELYCDRKAEIQMTKNPMFHERTEHIKLDCHFIRERVQDGSVSVFYISTKYQLADFLTKPLHRQQQELAELVWY